MKIIVRAKILLEIKAGMFEMHTGMFHLTEEEARDLQKQLNDILDSVSSEEEK